MAEAGPDLEEEALKSKQVSIPDSPYKRSRVQRAIAVAKKVARNALKVAVFAGRFAIGPGDETVAAVLPAIPNPNQQANEVSIKDAVTEHEKWKVTPITGERKGIGPPPPPKDESLKMIVSDTRPSAVAAKAAYLAGTKAAVVDQPKIPVAAGVQR